MLFRSSSSWPSTSCRQVVRHVQALCRLHHRSVPDEEDSAYVQARVLSALDLDRLLNLPLLLSALFATPYQLPSRLAGATVAGLALDALLMRPFGVTALALCATVLVGSALRSDLEGWPRRFAAAAAAILASQAFAAGDIDDRRVQAILSDALERESELTVRDALMASLQAVSRRERSRTN